MQIKDEASPNSRIRVLVVDDDSDYGSLVCEFFSSHGILAESRTTAADALEAVSQFTPGVALIDLSIGDTSGPALLKQLKAKPELKDCVYICVTGWTLEESEWRDLGFDHLFRKPADINRILAIVQACQTT